MAEKRGGGVAAADPKALSAAEYSRRVHQWLWDSLAAGPAAAPPPGAFPSSPFCCYLLAVPSPPPAALQAPRAPPTAARDPNRPAGREFAIPSLAERMLAEVVDALIVFFMKVAAFLSVLHLQGNPVNAALAVQHFLEMHRAADASSREDWGVMVAMAVAFRLVVCLYEMACIWGAGGATPGKLLLGLRVVTCHTSVLVAPSRVRVIPSSGVSMRSSAVRVLIKSFASCFPVLVFQHNRMTYDIVAGTIVVKRSGIQ